jgi:predicted SnoaL-like aldol condensation-catalyzing enzyme
MQTPDGKSNKESALEFLRLASSGKVREAFKKYVAQNFRHHNPYFRAGAKALAAAMKVNAAKNPNKVFEVEHALVDGDLVAVHSRVRLKLGEQELAVVHIFRFENGRIAELWDVGQAVPKKSPNENGMF